VDIWKRVKLCDFLEQRKKQLLIEADIEYLLVTISNKGEVKLREKKKGGLINAQKGYCVKAGDFIYSRLAVHTGAFGIIPSTLDGALVTNEMPSFEINDSKIHPDILISLLNIPTIKWQLTQLAKGMGRVRIKESMLLALTVLLPPRKEQDGLVRKISSANTKLSKLKSQLTHQQTLLKKLRQQILQEAIQGKLTTDFRAQNPDIEPAGKLLARIKAEKEQLIKEKKIKKQKPLPPISEEKKSFELPEGWVWCRVGEVTNYYEAGKSFKCINRHVAKNEWGVIKTSAITSSQFIEIEHKFYSAGVPHDISKKIQSNELIFCRASGSKGLAGKCVLVKKCNKNLLLSDKTPRLVTTQFVSKEFIFFQNETGYSSNYYESLNTGKSTSMNNITKDQLLSKPFPLPPLAEQKAIVTKVEKLLSICDQLETQITTDQTHTEQLMQAVLKEAFSQSEVA